MTHTPTSTFATTAPSAPRFARGVRERGPDDADRPGPGDAGGPGGQGGPEPWCLPVRFALGRLLVTPGALAALERAGAGAAAYLARHATCDWGDLDAEDQAANDRALVDGERLLSAYVLPNGEQLWIITEADRSSSTCLLPSDY